MAVFLRIEGLDPEDCLAAETDHDESAAHDLADRLFADIHNEYADLFEDLTGVVPVLDEDEHARLVEVSNIENPTPADETTDSPVFSFGPLDRDDLDHVGNANDLDPEEYDWVDACGYAYVRAEEDEGEPEAVTDGGTDRTTSEDEDHVAYWAAQVRAFLDSRDWEEVSETARYNADDVVLTVPKDSNLRRQRNREVFITELETAGFDLLKTGEQLIYVDAPEHDRLVDDFDADWQVAEDSEAVTDGVMDLATHEFRVRNDAQSIVYGPWDEDADEWMLGLSTEDGERVRLLFGKAAMYELWTEVHNTPWSRETEPRGTLSREIVEKVNGMDEDQLREVLETVDAVGGGER